MQPFTRFLVSTLCSVPWLADFPPPANAQTAPVWPAKLFAPYAYIPYEDAASGCLAATGQRYYTLAFIVSDPKGEPAWDGQKEMRARDGFYAQAIQTIRARGGDIIVSFGGEGGKELALASPDVASLATKYRTVVDRYSLTWLDLDIEGKTLANQAANTRRNAALLRLRSDHPGLRLTYTLPCDPTGLEPAALALLADAKRQGLTIESVNVMTMDYTDETRAGASMGTLAINAARAAHAQLLALGLADTPLGVTPMIGRNDVKSVVFSPADARTLLNFAQQTPWVRSLGFWSVNRDQARPGGEEDDCGLPQPPWAFTNLFKPFVR